jgi:hypothetical protein
VLENGIKPGVLTRQGLVGHDPKIRRAVNLEASRRGMKILSDAERDSVTKLADIGDFVNRMEVISKKIGNGALSGYMSFMSLGKEIDEMKADTGQIASAKSMKGTLSDVDLELVQKAFADPFTFDTSAKVTNARRIKTMRDLQLRNFNKYFPATVNPEQRMAIAEQVGISPEVLSAYDEEHSAKSTEESEPTPPAQNSAPAQAPAQAPVQAQPVNESIWDLMNKPMRKPNAPLPWNR